MSTTIHLPNLTGLCVLVSLLSLLLAGCGAPTGSAISTSTPEPDAQAIATPPAAPTATPSPAPTETLPPTPEPTLEPSTTTVPSPSLAPAPTATTAPSVTPEPPASTATPTSEVSDPLPPSQMEVVVIYSQSGGIAGRMDEWTLYSDGTIVKDDGTTSTTTSEGMVQLLTEIEALGFFELKPRYVPRDQCCDRITYTITVRNGGREHTVSALSGTEEVPTAFWEVAERISNIVSGETQ